MANAGLLNPFGNGGRTDPNIYYNNLDKNLWLSVSDMGKPVTITTSNNYAVILPDARQLTKLRNITIVNRSTVAIPIYNNNSQILKSLPINQSVICWCTNITTSSGVWTATIVGTSMLNSIGVGSQQTMGTLNTNVIRQGTLNMCVISSTVTCVTYQSNEGGVYASLFELNVSTNVITRTSNFLIYSHNASYAEYTPTVLKTSSNTAYIMFPSTYAYNNCGIGIVWNSSNIITGTSSITYAAGAGYNYNLMTYACVLPSTNLIVQTGTQASGSNYYVSIGVVTFSVSSQTHTLSNGANFAFSSYSAITTAYYCTGLAAVNSTTVLASYTSSSSNTTVLHKFTVGTGSITQVATLSLVNQQAYNTEYECRLVVLTPAVAIQVYPSGTAVGVSLIDITNMAILKSLTFTAPVIVTSVSASYLSADSIMISWKDTNGVINTAKITVSGTNIIMSNISTAIGNALNHTVCGMTATSAIVATKTDAGGSTSTIYANLVIAS